MSPFQGARGEMPSSPSCAQQQVPCSSLVHGWEGERHEAALAGQCRPFLFPLWGAGSQREEWEARGLLLWKTALLGGSFTGVDRELAGG